MVSENVEGVWSLFFIHESARSGDGVILILPNGQIVGGDPNYVYVGTYDITDGEMVAKIAVVHYRGEMLSVYGERESFTLELMSSPLQSGRIYMRGSIVDEPQRRIAIELHKVKELPDLSALH